MQILASKSLDCKPKSTWLVGLLAYYCCLLRVCCFSLGHKDIGLGLQACLLTLVGCIIQSCGQLRDA